MFKALFVILVLSSAGLAQSSSDGAFSVHHFKSEGYSLRPAQMREAESIYYSACATVQHDFHRGGGASELHPRFTVVIGAERNEVHTRRQPVSEIWMKKWDQVIFAQGVVVLAFEEMLTRDVIVQLANQAFRQSNATVNVVGLQ